MPSLLAQPAPTDATLRSAKPTALSAVKGMNDLLPEDMAIWEHVEATAAYVFRQYGYRAIRTPIVEQTAVFVRAIGEVTDIVEK